MQIPDICVVLAHATDATCYAVLCDGLILWHVGKCMELNASVHMQQDMDSAGALTDEHPRRSTAATRQVTQHPAVSPTQPRAATSPLEAATAVPLPDSANKVVLTARKRGRPSKADLALRRQMEEQQSAAATAEAAAPNTVRDAGRTKGAQLEGGKDGGKSSKSSNPGSKATGSRASGSKGKKQASAAAVADADDQADVAVSKPETQPAPGKTQARHVHVNAPCVRCMTT